MSDWHPSVLAYVRQDPRERLWVRRSIRCLTAGEQSIGPLPIDVDRVAYRIRSLAFSTPAALRFPGTRPPARGVRSARRARMTP